MCRYFASVGSRHRYFSFTSETLSKTFRTHIFCAIIRWGIVIRKHIPINWCTKSLCVARISRFIKLWLHRQIIWERKVVLLENHLFQGVKMNLLLCKSSVLVTQCLMIQCMSWKNSFVITRRLDPVSVHCQAISWR